MIDAIFFLPCFLACLSLFFSPSTLFLPPPFPFAPVDLLTRHPRTENSHGSYRSIGREREREKLCTTTTTT
ncbi:hypothetical protein F4809DRAFT_623925 [Biscogniauxia mediterranea]|nr:hypothetical protein F4809DRAFT_623925 [Biscogniauxia mediterranea]